MNATCRGKAATRRRRQQSEAKACYAGPLGIGRHPERVHSPIEPRSPNLNDSTAPPQPSCHQDFTMTRMTGQPHRDLLSFCFFSVVLYGTWFL